MNVPKVLIADDQESMRSLIRITLESGHFEILEAADGGSATRVAHEHQPDLVFLDWTMPGLTGIEVCRNLREDPRTAGAKIVMVSGRVDVEEQAEGFAAGADDYITKPFSPLELLDKVSEVLGPEAFI
jgi:two-component system phosphate regulon response regulator PhoB